MLSFAQLCVQTQDCCVTNSGLQGCAEIQRKYSRRHLLSTHRDLDDLVKHDVRRDVEVEDEILEEGGCRMASLAAPSS